MHEHEEVKRRREHAIRQGRKVLAGPGVTPSERELAESALRLLEADKAEVHPSILLAKLNALQNLEVRAEVLAGRHTQNPKH
jgi:hypothetical protein